MWLLALAPLPRGPSVSFKNSLDGPSQTQARVSLLPHPSPPPLLVPAPFSQNALPVTMVSPLWKASSEGNLESLIQLLNEATPVDIEVKGMSKICTPSCFLRALVFPRRVIF